MPQGSVPQRTLLKLVQVLGAADAVARKLQVTVGDLRSWVEGAAEMPTHIFLKAVDLLLEQPLENYVRPVDGRLIKPEPDSGKKCNNGE